MKPIWSIQCGTVQTYWHQGNSKAQGKDERPSLYPAPLLDLCRINMDQQSYLYNYLLTIV